VARHTVHTELTIKYHTDHKEICVRDRTPKQREWRCRVPGTIRDESHENENTPRPNEVSEGERVNDNLVCHIIESIFESGENGSGDK
jgi:hypothetical protein